MARHGYISFFQLGYLFGVRLGLNEQTGLALAIEKCFYASAFQAGLDYFVVDAFPADHTLPYEFIRKRLVKSKYGASIEAYELVHRAFQSRFPDNYSERESPSSDYSGAQRIEGFVSDLIIAMKNRSALVSVPPIPTHEEVDAFLPPELAMPISLLLTSLTPYEQKVPIPSRTLQVDDLKRLTTLLDSDLFAHYTEVCSDLDKTDVAAASAIERIRRRGEALVTHADRMLSLKTAAMQLLTLVPKVVDLAFGKLPGALAQFAANAANDIHATRRRLVIYEFNPLIGNLLELARRANQTAQQGDAS
jgi:hypothetical protein